MYTGELKKCWCRDLGWFYSYDIVRNYIVLPWAVLEKVPANSCFASWGLVQIGIHLIWCGGDSCAQPCQTWSKEYWTANLKTLHFSKPEVPWSENNLHWETPWYHLSELYIIGGKASHLGQLHFWQTLLISLILYFSSTPLAVQQACNWLALQLCSASYLSKSKQIHLLLFFTT